MYSITAFAVASSIWVVSGPPVPSSKEYLRGWCDGYSHAVNSVRRSRDDLRAAIGWPDNGPKEPSKESWIVDSAVNVMLDAIDKKIVLDPLPIGEDKVLPSGKIIRCEGGNQ
jgi:hypothetical protein